MESRFSNFLRKVGNTPLLRAKKLGNKLGHGKLYLKIERNNPSGTHKDRGAATAVKAALDNGFPGITVGSCGNYGVSIAMASRFARLPCKVFVPRSYKGSRTDEISKIAARITYTNGSYEDAVEESSTFAKTTGYYNGNPLGRGGEALIDAFASIAQEVYKSLKDETPESFWTSVGNGTTLSGIYKGIRQQNQQALLGAVSSLGNNAVIESYKQKRVVELKTLNIRETRVNEPLLNWKSYHAKEALIALKKNGFAYGATDLEMVKAASLIKEYEKISTSPASAASLSGFIVYANNLNPELPQVIVLTA